MSSFPARRSLLVAGTLSATIATLHLIIVVLGPAGYLYFGAADLAPLAAAGSPIPPLLTVGLALVFAIWAWYAFAAAGLVRRPPLLALGLWVIGAIYTVRGLALIPEVLSFAYGGGVPPRFVAFSFVALATGLAYLVGAWRGQPRDSIGRGTGVAAPTAGPSP